jgi:hypothetical protein
MLHFCECVCIKQSSDQLLPSCPIENLCPLRVRVYARHYKPPSCAPKLCNPKSYRIAGVQLPLLPFQPSYNIKEAGRDQEHNSKVRAAAATSNGKSCYKVTQSVGLYEMPNQLDTVTI